MSNSSYADEGTIAHALAAMCLEEGKPASAFVGRLIKSSDYEHASLSPSGASRWMRCPGSHALETRIKFVPRTFSLQVTDDMVAGVQVYLDNLAKYIVGRKVEVMVEQKLPVGHITGEEGATGSGDCVILDFDLAELQVHDLKFGRGVEVLADDNEQLMLYLLGALEVFAEFAPPGGWKNFRGVIHQPRINEEPSEDVWAHDDLMRFAEKAKAAAELARGVKEVVDGRLRQHSKAVSIEEHLNPGDKQCKFCDAKPTCPALARSAAETVLAEFVSLDELPVPAKAALVPVPAENERLAKFKALTPLFRSWCDAIDAHAEAEILAGRPVPGFKVVQGKRGNRKWRDENEAEQVLKSMRVKHDQMYDYSVISPTTAEKRTKGEDAPIGSRQWKKLQELITQSDGKPTVVPVDDKRPALEIKPVLDEFPALPSEVTAEEFV